MNRTTAQNQAEKAVRLVRYLLELAKLRTKLIRDINDYEKVLWFSTVPQAPGCFTQAWGLPDGEPNPDVWLEVKSQREPELPALPSECKDWANLTSLKRTNDLPELLPEITRQIPNPDWREGSDQPATIQGTERLREHAEVKKTWDRYLEDEWLPWMKDHDEWKQVHEVYSALFAIHQEQLRVGEEYELVLGLGLLTWQAPAGQRIRRHLLVADAILEFEAGPGKFIVRPHTEGGKLRPELDMLDIQEQPAHAEDTARESLTQAEDNPWEKGCIEGVLQALVHSLNPQGHYEGALEANGTRATNNPTVEYAPALILRKRSAKGLTEALNRIKEQIESGKAIPGEFKDLVEIPQADEREPGDEPEAANASFDGEVFFPKPSNDEQRRIVDNIRAANGVLVQGPPGTGKSHTIANLICHLLATGQRMLITAKTPRALQVLEGLIPDELRPLCINLLGSGLEERRSLESSVGGILRKSEEWNEDSANRERAESEERLRKLREMKADVTRRLRDIRESETHTQSIAEGAYQGTAARIAEAVNRDRADYEWFTDSISLDKTCPISPNGLLHALEELRQFPLEKRRELKHAWPEELPSLECIADLVKNETNAAEEERNSAHGTDDRLADLLARKDSQVIEAIHDAFSKFRDTRRRLLATPGSWMNDALRDAMGGNSTLWQELLCVTGDVITSTNELVATADETQVEFPDTTDIRSLRDDARKLKEHMENGGKLGWGLFRPKPVRNRLYVIKTVKIGGRPCSTVAQFANLADALHVRIECEKAWGFWKGRSEKVEGPYALQLTALKALRDGLNNALALEGLIDTCQDARSRCPEMDEPVWEDESQVETIITSCRLALARIRKRLATEDIQATEAKIFPMAAQGSVHSVTADLRRAIHNRDIDEFSRCASMVQDLKEQRQRLEQLDKYLSSLRGSLPQLTESLEQTCNESSWEGRIQRIDDAWHWAQARYWIEDYIQQGDVPNLSARAKEFEGEINGIIAKLASLHAWSFCFSRLKEDHRRHMEAWQQSMQRLGKGTGKHAPYHRREAQGHLNECREAVPAWVMPLHRVWDTIYPAPGMFDVIIVDEASQCGVEALPLFYLGKKILIVGDDKQISPEAVGLLRDSVQRLMEEFLHDFQFRSSFDIESSLFDHGKLRYGEQRITLCEHFRCMPEIIRFSNDLCYADTPLIPLRQYGPNRLPPLEHVFVGGGYREGIGNRTINRPESEAIVEKIAEICGDSRYDEKTMSVVVLQGEAQAALIEQQLLERLGAHEMERRRLVCGNPYSFQGDERDIMFLSLVAASNERIGPLTSAGAKRRFNVAASRARDMMILFHSVTCDELSASCLRRRLLDFFENTMPQQIAGINREELERRAAQDNRLAVTAPAPFDSWFEVDVALELVRKGFNVLPQHKVAGKHIDLVVEGGQARLAVECDGDNWHGADRYEADMQRQRQLERCSWEFFRVRESVFYADRQAALEALWMLLEDRGIFPTSNAHRRSTANTESLPGIERIQRSSELEKENAADDKCCLLQNHWSGDGTSSSGPHPEEVSETEIQKAITDALSKCPHNSCTVHSLTSRVLKEVGVLTRGNPRSRFERRVMLNLNTLEAHGRIEKYKAKNNRVRLLGA